MSRRFHRCLRLRPCPSHLRRPRKQMQPLRVHLRLWLPKHYSNRRLHYSRDLDRETEKLMVVGVYRGVKRSTGAKPLQLVVVSRELSRSVTTYNPAIV